MPPTTRETPAQTSTPTSRVTPSPSRAVVPPTQGSRVAAISAEIPVEIHGSRKSPRDGQPIEPFQEETVSVILFPQGGIVRLEAQVARGQMIAITNLNSQRGMLCRVSSVRAYPNLKSYVELEFTQPAPGFWGVDFPQEVAPASKAPEPEANHAPETTAAHIREEVRANDPAPAPAARAREEVHKKEPAPPPATPIAAGSAVAEAQAPAANAAHLAAADENLVHVTSDEPEVTAASAAKPAVEKSADRVLEDLKPEDFWGASFPSELIDAAPASSPKPESSPASSASPSSPSRSKAARHAAESKTHSAKAKSRPAAESKSAASASPADLPAEDDTTWAELLSQLPAKLDPPKAVEPPEIHEDEDDVQLERVAPNIETRANESPRAKTRPDNFATNSDALPPVPQSASAASLKELERLALEHLDANQDDPHAHSAPRTPAHSEKPRRTPPAPERPESGYEQHPVASSASALHAFTSPPMTGENESAQARPKRSRATPAPASKRAPEQSFGDFLKDPEPRTASSRAYQAHTDALNIALMEPLPPLVEPVSSGSKSKTTFAVIALAIVAVAGAVLYVANRSGSGSPAVVGKPAAERAPLPPDNLRPFAPDLPSIAAATSPATSNASTNSAAPASNVEAELTTAVTPPAKNDPSPLSRSEQPRTSARHSAIPPVTLPAPVSGSDAPAARNVEPPPTVASGSSAMSGAETFSKLGATTTASIPRPAAPSAPVTPATGGNVTEPRLIWSPPPVYPQLAKQNNIQGDVKIQATIDESGRITEMKPVSGPSILQGPAMDALRQWKYEPSMLNGKPVAAQLLVVVEFRR